ncbi:MAG: GAF domain-containing protein, partial [Anaerolineae bacterium]|nr:GAF domain-containing protein [Anaerolineae bacterium]
YVTKPLREAEVLAAVERGLEDVRLRRHHDQLRQQLTKANSRLEVRVKELRTLYEIGQSVTMLRDLNSVFARVMDGALILAQADQAFLLLRDEKAERLVLRAGNNLSIAMLDHMGEAVTDQLAELVMSSRKDMLVEGEGLRRFKVSREFHATAYVPLVVQNKAIGVLAVGNTETRRAFRPHHARLLRSLADYAAIAIVSVRLSQLLAERAQAVIMVQQQSRLRDAQRNRQVRGLLSRVHQALIALESELLHLSQADRKSQPEVQRRLGALSQQVRQLITQLVAFTRQH